MGVRMKLQPLRDNIEGKRPVVIDDSIVRGTTMVQLVKMLRNAGAKEIHIRINSPEVIWRASTVSIPTCSRSLSVPTRRSMRFVSISAPIRWPSFRSRACLRSCLAAVTAMRALPAATPWRFPRFWPRQVHGGALSPRTTDKPLHFDDDAVVEKYDDLQLGRGTRRGLKPAMWGQVYFGRFYLLFC